MTPASPGRSGAVPSRAAAAGSSVPGIWRATPQHTAGGLKLPVGRRVLLSFNGFALALVLVVVVDDPQDFDKAEGSSKPPQGRLLVGVDLGHGPSRLPPRRLVTPGPQVQVDPAALELKFVDLALAVVLAARLEGQDLQVAGEMLQLGQQFSYGHPTQRSAASALCGLEVDGT